MTDAPIVSSGDGWHRRLVLLGMNAFELDQNPQAHQRVVHDLNREPALPFADACFDGAMCTVSVDYLVRLLEVFDEVARVLRPGPLFVCTFSNRCFPTKVIRGWLATDDEFHVQLVAEYFRRSAGWDQPRIEQRPTPGDPLFAVWAVRKTESHPSLFGQPQQRPSWTSASACTRSAPAMRLNARCAPAPDTATSPTNPGCSAVIADIRAP